MDVLIFIFIIVFVVFGYRYIFKYSVKSGHLYQKISYVNHILDNKDDIKNEKIDMNRYRPDPFLTKPNEKELIVKKYLENETYNRLFKELENLNRYKNRFWKLEGVIYITVLIVLVLLLSIGR